MYYKTSYMRGHRDAYIIILYYIKWVMVVTHAMYNKYVVYRVCKGGHSFR